MRNNSEYAEIYDELLSELNSMRTGGLSVSREHVIVEFKTWWTDRPGIYGGLEQGTEWKLRAHAYECCSFRTEGTTLEEATSEMISLIQRKRKQLCCARCGMLIPDNGVIYFCRDEYCVEEYRHINCLSREEEETKVWWISDPLRAYEYE